MSQMINTLLEHDVFAVTLGCIVAVLIVGIRTIGSTLRAVSREKTRREIAAYIAEGSMTPEQGERLMRAGDSNKVA
ncbi:MAG: hypothetical protein AB7G11_17835 [Phycisphaerales bacterium]